MHRNKSSKHSKKQNSVSPIAKITKIVRSPSKTENKKLLARPKVDTNKGSIGKNKVICNKKKDIKQIKSASTIVQMTQKLDIQHLIFDQLWTRLIDIVDGYVKFTIFIPKNCNQIGEEVLKDGRFILSWLKIVSKNDFILVQVVYKYVEDNLLPKIEKYKNDLSAYLSQKIQTKTLLTSAKPPSALKRKNMNISQKKQEKNQDQIIYPKLQQYVTPSSYSYLKKNQNIRKKNKFLLSCFEIQKIFSLSQVQVIGVIKEYGQKFVIILVKDKKTSQQYTCVGVTSQSVYEIQKDDQIKNISQDMKKQFKIGAYLDLDGKKSGQVWIDSIPNQK